MEKLKVLDLFSGIGGFSYGLHQTGGFETVAFVEIDEFCQAILRKNYPGVPIFSDVKEFTGEEIEADVITGGFPCQDISVAGKGAGLRGERSGLWSEIVRIAGVIQPKYLIIENVPMLRKRGIGRVLSDLCQIGYDAEWNCIPAKAVGAPHERDRIWLVGYPNSEREHHSKRGCHRKGERQATPQGVLHPSDTGLRSAVPNSNDTGRQEQRRASTTEEKHSASERIGTWPPEPGICRMANGIPNRIHRIKSLGNSLVPQIPEVIGRAILELEWQKNA